MNSLLKLELRQVKEGVEGYELLNHKLTEEIKEISGRDVKVSMQCEEIESEIGKTLQMIKDVSLAHSKAMSHMLYERERLSRN